MLITRLDELCVKLMKLRFFLFFIHERDSAVFDIFVRQFSRSSPVFSCEFQLLCCTGPRQ